MTAQASLPYNALSGSHPQEPKLLWMVALSCALHAIAFVVFMGLPPASSKNIYFSPVYSVDLVGLPPAGSSLAGAPAKKSGAAQAKKPDIKLWKGPSTLESQAKTQSQRSHPVLTIPAKGKELAPRRAEPEPAGTEPAGTESKTAESAGALQTTAGATAETPGADTQTDSAGSGVPGGVPGGTGGGGMANLRFSQYYQSIYAKVYQAWTLPEYVIEKEGSREAIVAITVQRDGKILSAIFEKTSGNQQFDASVMNAIKKANPLPPLPDDFRESVLEIGIRFIPPQKGQ
jgi:TolA protein